MKTKTFDCVQMKRKGAERLNALLNRLEISQQLDFWEKAHKEILDHQKKLTSGSE